MFQAKCVQYWPGQVGEEQQFFGEIAVKLLLIEEWADFVVRTLSVTKVRSICVSEMREMGEREETVKRAKWRCTT